MIYSIKQQIKYEGGRLEEREHPSAASGEFLKAHIV
jgi:hypothetical protein